MNISELNQRFGKPNTVKILAGSGGLPCVQISNSLADAEIYLQGDMKCEFERTKSRLYEMQSIAYLQMPHEY